MTTTSRTRSRGRSTRAAWKRRYASRFIMQFAGAAFEAAPVSFWWRATSGGRYTITGRHSTALLTAGTVVAHFSGRRTHILRSLAHVTLHTSRIRQGLARGRVP